MELSFLPMRFSKLSMYAATAAAAVGILAGCTGNALQATPSNPSAGAAALQNGRMMTYTAARGAIRSGAQRHGDWVSPDKKAALVYISDYGGGAVDFYNYTPGSIGSQAGSITSGISGPQGLCSDKKGNVYVANTNNRQVLEYKHGSTTLKKTLATSTEYVVGCAVSKKGNLAVTAICSYPSCGEGALLVYKKAKGTPKSYQCSNLYRYYFVAYDKAGNAFVDGSNASGGFGLCELPASGSSLQNISVSAPPSFPGGVSYDGTYIIVGDQLAASLIQYTISGTTATKAGTVSLTGASDVDQQTVYGGYVIGPDAGNAAAEVWNYPAGGSIINSKTGFSEPVGSAVSK